MTQQDDRITPDFDSLREQSLASIRRHQRQRRTRGKLIAWSGAAVIAAAATGAVWTVVASQELREHSAVCYDAQSLGSRHTDIGSVDPASGHGVELALSMCEAAWRQGIAGPNGSDAPPDGVINTVPRLYICLQQNGVIAVFPYENGDRRTCAQLGLNEPER